MIFVRLIVADICVVADTDAFVHDSVLDVYVFTYAHVAHDNAVFDYAALSDANIFAYHAA